MLCPVCNGMERLASVCPRCGSAMADAGRLTDTFGPYAPYRPVDELKRTDGLPDLIFHLCYHRLDCETCGFRDVRAVRETAGPAPGR